MNDVQLILGDCREAMAELEPGSVSAIVTDPPYGAEVAGDGYGRRQNYGGVGRAILGDGDLSALVGMLAQASRVLTRHAWVIVFCSPKRHAETASAIGAAGLGIAGEVVWDKVSPGLGGGIRYQHEIALLAKQRNPSGRDALFSVIRSMMPREGRSERHPHEKPLDVMLQLVRYASRPGEIVLDPFMGSGTTGLACQRLSRRFIGIELDPTHYETARQRILGAPGETTRQRSLFSDVSPN